VYASSYDFTLPVSFLPVYKQHKRFGTDQDLDVDYTFQYSVEIIS